jgi:hypothetical protein
MNTASIRNRIVGHVERPAATLRPHPLNWRTHGDAQRVGLAASLAEVGKARSVLAYVPDADKAAHPDPLEPAAPLMLIDGHLRRDELGEEPIAVEVLDVTDEEARKLLLSLDPLAALAGSDDAALQQLLDTTPAENQALAMLWQGLAAAPEPDAPARDSEPQPPEQYLVLVTCRDEAHQASVLKRCLKEGWKCKPLTS